MDGWIKLHRCLLSKAIWQLNDAQRIVFITVLLMANRREKQWLWKGEKFTAGPGQFVTSFGNLSKTARVSRQSARTALVNLKKLDFLTYESTKTGILVTVINWALYQSQEKESTDIPTNSQPTANQQSTTNKNHKNHKNDKKGIYDYFSDFWREYPRKEKKVMAQKIFDRLNVDDPLMEKIMDSLYRFIESEQWTKDDGKFIPQPTTWLNQRRWEDGT